MAAEEIPNEILEPLDLMVKEIKKRVSDLKDISEKLKKLQNEFFTEIKFIADVVGIDMPEPTEIDLLQDQAQNPLQLLEEYKKAKGIQTDDTVVDMLQNMFDGVEPVINRTVGGSEYREELLNVIKSTCDIKPEDIHINDVYKNTKEYAQLIEKNDVEKKDK